MLESTKRLNKFRRYIIPPGFDIILDNPLEEPEDTRATLDLLHAMPRPFTLNIYSLRVIPNTLLARKFEERGITGQDIRQTYSRHKATIANIAVYMVTVFPFA